MVPPERAEAQPQQPQEAAVHAESPSLIFKYLLVGDAYTGKSTLLQRFTTGEFSDHYKQTIGVDFSINTLKLASGERVKLQAGAGLSLAGAAISIIFVATKVLSRQNTSFVATKKKKNCRDKSMFSATNSCSDKTIFCRNKNLVFVATKMLLVAAAAIDTCL